jgi:hypothetical protein
LPVIIDRGRLRVARWNEVAAHQRGMIKRSRLFGTPLTVKAGSLEMGVPACGGASGASGCDRTASSPCCRRSSWAH